MTMIASSLPVKVDGKIRFVAAIMDGQALLWSGRDHATEEDARIESVLALQSLEEPAPTLPDFVPEPQVEPSKSIEAIEIPARSTKSERSGDDGSN